MRDVTIYRWSRGDRYADEDGVFGDWVPRETLFCSEAWMRTKTESEEELGFWSAFGKEPRVTRSEDGTIVFSADNLVDGFRSTQRMLETFEPIALRLADDVADEVEETLEDTRCLEWEETEAGALVRIDTERFGLAIVVNDAGIPTVEVTRYA